MTFPTNYNRPKAKLEEISSKSKVVKTGYVPLDVKIQEMMNAGRQLVDSRRLMYDSTKGVTSLAYNPTRSPHFDLAEASQLILATKRAFSRLKAQDKLDTKVNPSTKVGEDVVSPKNDPPK